MKGQLIHHSALSFRKLRSMKILDYFSVLAVVLQDDIVDNDILGRQEVFGQFGPIRSIRVIQESKPVQIYVRFHETTSATAALQWCQQRPLTFEDVKYGYQKYCVKFINKQKCRKQDCPNRHSYYHSPNASILCLHQYVDVLSIRLGANEGHPDLCRYAIDPEQGDPSDEELSLSILCIYSPHYIYSPHCIYCPTSCICTCSLCVRTSGRRVIVIK